MTKCSDISGGFRSVFNLFFDWLLHIRHGVPPEADMLLTCPSRRPSRSRHVAYMSVTASLKSIQHFWPPRKLGAKMFCTKKRKEVPKPRGFRYIFLSPQKPHILTCGFTTQISTRFRFIIVRSDKLGAKNVLERRSRNQEVSGPHLFPKLFFAWLFPPSHTVGDGVPRSVTASLQKPEPTCCLSYITWPSL